MQRFNIDYELNKLNMLYVNNNDILKNKEYLDKLNMIIKEGLSEKLSNNVIISKEKIKIYNIDYKISKSKKILGFLIEGKFIRIFKLFDFLKNFSPSKKTILKKYFTELENKYIKNNDIFLNETYSNQFSEIISKISKNNILFKDNHIIIKKYNIKVKLSKSKKELGFRFKINGKVKFIHIRNIFNFLKKYFNINFEKNNAKKIINNNYKKIEKVMKKEFKDIKSREEILKEIRSKRKNKFSLNKELLDRKIDEIIKVI